MEDVLAEFLDGVAAASAALKVRRLEHEEWHRQYEEEQKRREDHERRIKIERTRQPEQSRLNLLKYKHSVFRL